MTQKLMSPKMIKPFVFGLDSEMHDEINNEAKRILLLGHLLDTS